jgi:hypothetical protein
MTSEKWFGEGCMYGIEGDVIVEEERGGFTSTALLGDKKE